MTLGEKSAAIVRLESELALLKQKEESLNLDKESEIQKLRDEREIIANQKQIEVSRPDQFSTQSTDTYYHFSIKSWRIA